MITHFLPNWNGAETDNCLVNSDPEQLSVVLLRWDFPQLASDSLVDSAELHLHVRSYSTEEVSYPLYAVRQEWDPSTLIWNATETTSLWDETTPLGFVIVHGDGSADARLNAAGVAVIQNWLMNPSENFGMVVADAAFSAEYFTFDCSEAASGFPPRLLINYSVPSSPD